MGRKRSTRAQRKQRPRRSAPPPRTVARYPDQGLIDALLLAMVAKRAAAESAGLAAGGVLHVWGFGCVDEATAENQTVTSFTSAEVADGGSVLKHAFGMQQRVRGIWGYGLAYVGPRGSLTPGMPLSLDARNAFHEQRIDDCPIPDLEYTAAIYDARGVMHSAHIPMASPNLPAPGTAWTADHADTGPRAGEFVEAFHDGSIDADIWFSALALDVDRNEQIIQRVLPDMHALAFEHLTRHHT